MLPWKFVPAIHEGSLISVHFNALGDSVVPQNLGIPEIYGGLWGQGIWNQALLWMTLGVGSGGGAAILNAATQPSFILLSASAF